MYLENSVRIAFLKKATRVRIILKMIRIKTLAILSNKMTLCSKNKLTAKTHRLFTQKKIRYTKKLIRSARLIRKITLFLVQAHLDKVIP